MTGITSYCYNVLNMTMYEGSIEYNARGFATSPTSSLHCYKCIIFPPPLNNASGNIRNDRN